MTGKNRGGEGTEGKSERGDNESTVQLNLQLNQNWYHKSHRVREISYKEIRWNSLRESNVRPWISNVKSNGNIREYKVVARGVNGMVNRDHSTTVRVRS